MNKVDSCVQSPLACAVFPTLGARHPKGYYRTDNVLPGPGIHEHTVYVSVEAVEVLARKEGWISPEEHANQRAHIEGLARELEQYKGDLAEAQRHLDAIDVIESADFRARKKTGRPRAAA
jgi:hypothetical protein